MKENDDDSFLKKFPKTKPEFKKSKNTTDKQPIMQTLIELSTKPTTTHTNLNNYSPKKENNLANDDIEKMFNKKLTRHYATVYRPHNKYFNNVPPLTRNATLILENKRKLSRLSSTTYFDKNKIDLTEDQKKFSVTLIKRNYNNNVYLNNIDQSISYVIPYKYKYPIFIYLLFGIPFLITKISNRKLIQWRGIPCHFTEANFYLIIDGYGNYHICNFTKRNFFTNFGTENTISGFNKKKHIPTIFSNIDFNEKEEYHEINYVSNKYYCYKKFSYYNYDINNNGKDNGNKEYYFEAPIFSLSCATNKKIYEIFEEHYLKPDETKFQREIFGQNKLVLKVVNFFTILFGKLLSFVTLYFILAIIFWWLEKYYFSYVVMVLSIILLFITTYQKYLNKKKVVDFSLNKQEKIIVYESSIKKAKYVENENLVPGQVIILKEEDVLPCDCLLLDGFCSCIESSLTGESSSILKYKLPKNNAKFKYAENQKCFLFCGTKIENCFPHQLKALVIGTGFNTQRGNLIQSVLFPKKSNYNFYKENIAYFFLSLISFIMGTIILLYYSKKYGNSSFITIFENIFDLLLISLPPALPLSLALGTFYYQYSLINRKISCSGVYRLMASGKINKIIFDKTGTLTEEDLDLYGYVSSTKKNGILILDSKEDNSNLYLAYLSEYYKNVFHTQIIKGKKQKRIDDTDNTITYFMECLATCHSVTRINDENKGNNIDIKIFNNVNWIYDSLDNNSRADDQFEVKPKKYFKITEEQFFIKNDIFNNIINKNKEINSYKLKVILRNHFESRNQSMSVIVKNNFDDSLRFYIKGAPEKIIAKCINDSIPINYDEIHRKYTLQGFRVLACATKLISENSKNELEIINSGEYANYRGKDLIFLGLIIFQNKIKPNTKKTLKRLVSDGLFPIISTGDNAFTSISLVKECHLIENNSKFCIMEIDINGPTQERNTNIYFKERPKSIKEIKKNISLTCTFQIINYDKPSRNMNYCCSVILDENMSENEIMNFQSKTENEVIRISQLNDRILSEKNIKLCVHSHVFDLLFFRDREGLSTDEENKLVKNKLNVLISNAEKKDGELNKINEQINLLRQIIVDKTILFFRMNPNDKTKLVQLFKKQDPNNIVAMVGDGANDCSALISADVGISLKSRENIIMTSHLMAKTKSITIINDIINIGKACYENSTIIFKILLIYSIIITVSRCLLKSNKDNFTKMQYFYLDCVVILFGCCLMSLSDPNYKVKEKISRRFTMNIYLISIVGHSFFQLFLLLIYYYGVIKKNDYYFSDVQNDNVSSDTITTMNSYLFFFNSIQLLSLIFALNYFSLCKRYLFKNRLFSLYLVIDILILAELLSVESYNFSRFSIHVVEFVKLDSNDLNSQNSRLVLFGFSVMAFIIAMIWEYLLYSVSSNKEGIRNKIKNED